MEYIGGIALHNISFPSKIYASLAFSTVDMHDSTLTLFLSFTDDQLALFINKRDSKPLNRINMFKQIRSNV